MPGVSVQDSDAHTAATTSLSRIIKLFHMFALVAFHVSLLVPSPLRIERRNLCLSQVGRERHVVNANRNANIRKGAMIHFEPRVYPFTTTS